METEVQTKAPLENGAQVEESPAELTDAKTPEKEDPQTLKVKKSTRSRSRTPQIVKENNPEEITKTKKEEKKEKKSTSPVSEEHAKKKDKKVANKVEEDVNGHSEKKTRKGDKDKKSAESPAKKDENVEESQVDASKNAVVTPAGGEVTDTKKPVAKSPRKRDKQEENLKKTPTKVDPEVVEPELQPKTIDTHKSEEDMDPLILGSDEPDPELQFDESSDIESGKGSPILTRCKTRRSHTRNIPTPKTPKSIDNDSDKNSIPATPDILDSESTKAENLNDTNDSLDVQDVSTRAEVGSDVTRLDYIAHNDSIALDDQSYFNSIRERSIRHLSPRRPIHRGSESYRLRAIRNSQTRSLEDDEDVDNQVGLKRKRSPTPENRKKFKSSSPNLFSSPFRLSSRFIADGCSSTPKLTSYKDQNKDIHQNIGTEIEDSSGDKRNWCSLM